jgi:hypothetical protein
LKENRLRSSVDDYVQDEAVEVEEVGDEAAKEEAVKEDAVKDEAFETPHEDPTAPTTDEASAEAVQRHSEWDSRAYFLPYVYFLDSKYVREERSERHGHEVRSKLAARSVFAPLKELLQKEETTSLTVHEYDFQKTFGKHFCEEEMKPGLHDGSTSGKHDLLSVLVLGDSIYCVFVRAKAIDCGKSAKTIKDALSKSVQELEKDFRVFRASNREVRGKNVLLFGFPAFPFLRRSQVERCLGCISCAEKIVTEDDILGRTVVDRSENLREFLVRQGIRIERRSASDETKRTYRSIFTRYVASSTEAEHESVSCLPRIAKQMKRMLAFLTPEQHEILECEDEYVALLGDYGTGKTWILQNRLKKLLHDDEKSRDVTSVYIVNCARDRANSPTSVLTRRYSTFVVQSSIDSRNVHVQDVWDFIEENLTSPTSESMESHQFYEELERAVVVAASRAKEAGKIVHFLMDEFRIPGENLCATWSPWEKAEESKRPESLWIACRPSREGGWSSRGRADRAFPQSPHTSEKFLTRRRRTTTCISEFYEYECMEDAGIDARVGKNAGDVYTEHPKTVFGTEPEVMDFPSVDALVADGVSNGDSTKIFQIALGIKTIREHLATKKENREFFPVVAIAHLPEEILLDVHRCMTEFLDLPSQYFSSKGDLIGSTDADVQIYHQEAFRGCEAPFVILIEDRGCASQFYHGSIMRATTHLIVLDDPDSPRESIYKAAKHAIVRKLECNISDDDVDAFRRFVSRC